MSYKAYGLSFGPYLFGQKPPREVSETQLRTRMKVIAPYTHWIRTFGTTNGLEKVGFVAHEMGLKSAIGAWLSADRSSNEQHLSSLIRAGKAGQVDLAIVGAEVLLRKDLPPEELVAYIQRVKRELPGIPVATADGYQQLLGNQEVTKECDVLLVNYYPYWEGIPVEQAIEAIHEWHERLKAKWSGKTIIVAETGWPSCGETIGNAVPSLKNAATFFLNFVSWARANNVPYFYFSAFDERWKTESEGPQGACLGIWDEVANLKPDMQDVFDNKVVVDKWSGTTIPGGPGNPVIELTFVPPYGSSEDLKGQVRHVRPVDYKVAVYIYVSGWWTKPRSSLPLTPLRPDGSWTCDITTGGADEKATKIAAFLAPASYSPPPLLGAQNLPAELSQKSVSQTIIERRVP